MKTTFLLFACTCLLSGLSALNFPLEDENFNAETFENAFENGNDNGLENSFLENNEENLIASYPGHRPIRISTTTTERPSSTPTPGPTRPPPPRPPTRPPPPSPPTRPPPPSPPTRPPPPRPTTRPPPPSPPTRPPPPRPPTRPPPPRPPTRPPPPRPSAQIYENSVRGMGPFASQLINIVRNREGGKQKTVQRNDVLYNFRGLRVNRDLSDEETQE